MESEEVQVHHKVLIKSPGTKDFQKKSTFFQEKNTFLKSVVNCWFG